MKQNLGKLDRIFRFLLAFWWTTPLAPQTPSPWFNWAIFVLGWWALFESFVGWCPLHTWLGINNKHQ